MPSQPANAFFATMTDLTPYLTAGNDWITPCAEQMGWGALAAYYNRVFLRLLRMPKDSHLRVTDIVRPDNYELFLHCVCAAIRELEGMGEGTYYIEDRGRLILKR